METCLIRVEPRLRRLWIRDGGAFYYVQQICARGGRLGLPPQTPPGDQSPDPIFASRRLKLFLTDDAQARRMPEMIKTSAKRRREPEGIGITRPLCGVQRDGNRKS